MGRYAKNSFGRETFGDVGIIVAGTIIEWMEAEILGYFDDVISSKDRVYHAHVARLHDKTYPIAFNVYGGPALIDLLAVMHDGGCRNLIFVGFAGGYQHLDVGDVTLPDRAYHLDGIYHHIEREKSVSFADTDLKDWLEAILTGEEIPLHHGANISVPSVTLQPPAAVRHQLNPLTVEMELAACFARAKTLGIRASGALVITDSKNHQFSSKGDAARNTYRPAHLRVMQAVVSGLPQCDLPALPNDDAYSLADYFANYQY